MHQNKALVHLTVLERECRGTRSSYHSPPKKLFKTNGEVFCAGPLQ